MINPQSPFGQASQFFGSAFNDMKQASAFQERIQGAEPSKNLYSEEYDRSHMYGATPPQTNPYLSNQTSVDNIESLKEELLSTARAEQRSSNGHIAVRAGGGINTAVRR